MKCLKCGGETVVLSFSANSRRRKCESCGFEGRTVEDWAGEGPSRSSGRPAVKIVRPVTRPPIAGEERTGLSEAQALKEIRGY